MRTQSIAGLYEITLQNATHLNMGDRMYLSIHHDDCYGWFHVVGFNADKTSFVVQPVDCLGD